MVAGRQNADHWEPSPLSPLSCDPGQVRKVSWAGVAPRLADLSAAGEEAGAGARGRRPPLGDSGRRGDTFVSSLGAPRLGGGGRGALRGEGCGRAGTLTSGEVWAEGGGRRGSGSGGRRMEQGMECRAREPGETFRPGPAVGGRWRGALLALGNWGHE